MNIGKPKAIEPDAIQRPNRRTDWTKRVVTNEGDFERLETPTWQPDAALRAMGYTRNPAICGHEHKRMSTATMRFRCTDCGKDVGNG